MHVRDDALDGKPDGAATIHSTELPRHLVDVLPDDVGTLQNQVDRVPREGHLAAADLVEERLQFVCQPLQHRELQHARVALERVKRPKHGVDRGLVLGIAFEGEHTLLDILEQILRFGAEHLPEFLVEIPREDADGLIQHVGIRRGRQTVRRRDRRPGRGDPRLGGRRHRLATVPGHHGGDHPGLPDAEILEISSREHAGRPGGTVKPPEAGRDRHANRGGRLATERLEFPHDRDERRPRPRPARFHERQFEAELLQEGVGLLGSGDGGLGHERRQETGMAEGAGIRATGGPENPTESETPSQPTDQS